MGTLDNTESISKPRYVERDERAVQQGAYERSLRAIAYSSLKTAVDQYVVQAQALHPNLTLIPHYPEDTTSNARFLEEIQVKGKTYILPVVWSPNTNDDSRPQSFVITPDGHLYARLARAGSETAISSVSLPVNGRVSPLYSGADAEEHVYIDSGPKTISPDYFTSEMRQLSASLVQQLEDLKKPPSN